MKAIQKKASLSGSISLLLLILLISLGSLTPTNSVVIKPEMNPPNYNTANNFSEDISSSMAPNEGDIPNWAPESEPTNIPEENNSPAKEQPGFDFLMALLLAALSAVQIKKRSQAIKKK